MPRLSVSLSNVRVIYGGRGGRGVYNYTFYQSDSQAAFPLSQHAPRARELTMSFVHVKRGGIAEPSSAPGAAGRPMPAATPSHEEIARAAFGHWQSHGGDAEQNWLRCERQLKDRGVVLG